MAESNVLKEFLVKIGFKVDEEKCRRFQEVMHSTAKNALEMSKLMVPAALAATAALKPIAQQLDVLYFASRRTGASAGELKQFAFAAEQIGISAEKARGAVEGLAAARRVNPGLNGILGGLGIDPRQTDNARVMVELLGKLRGMPHYQGAQIAAMFGLDEQTFLMLEQGLPEMQKYLALREKMFSEAGINPDAMTARSHAFMTQWRTFEAAAGNLADIIAYRLLPWGDKVLTWLTDMVGLLTRADKATGGWSSKLLGLAVAAKGIASAWGLYSKLLRLGTVSAGPGIAAAEGSAAAVEEESAFALAMRLNGWSAAGGEAAGAAGAEGAAAAGLGAVALPAIIIAAVGAALVWMMVHRDQVRAFVSGAVDKVKEGAHDVHEAFKAAPKEFVSQTIKTGIESLLRLPSGSVDAALSKVKSTTGAASSSLLSMIAGFEGHAKNGYGMYRDVAGRLTAGFGHLVRPGENFSHLDRAGALALLARDMRAAVDAVHRLVKVHLNKNQEQALADFVYNLGAGRLAGSTLLRKLNSGDFAGAANQFQYWNHALVNGHMTALQSLSDRRAFDAQLFRTPDVKVNLDQKNDYHISSTDPHGAASEVARRQRDLNADLVRNLAGVVQ